MKNVVLIFSIWLVVSNISAQITITNSTFPVVGDTLKTAIRFSPSGLNMGTVNGPQVWDFSTLNAGNKQNEIYKSAASGPDAAAFPDANLLLNVDGQEQYLKSSSTKIEGLGLGGANDFIDVPLVIKYSKRPVLRTAPLNFINSTASNSEFRIDISANILPDSLLALISISFDSIRIQFANNARGVVDAYGTLKMQNKEFPVLREKVETYSETKVFIKFFNNWFDVGQFLGGNIPEGFENLLGMDTTFTYNFYTDSKKEILVSAEYNTANSLQEVVFADLGGVVSSSNDTYIPAIKVYPNPTSDFLFVQTPDWKEGTYLVTISDLSGKMLHAEPVGLNPDTTRQIDISNLSTGTYLLTIRNQFNSFAGTTKFVVK
jgi:hypothetical protein